MAVVEADLWKSYFGPHLHKTLALSTRGWWRGGLDWLQQSLNLEPLTFGCET